MNAGDRIGRYDIVRELGRGGMGTVYLAEHTLIGRTAAIKVLLPAFSQNEAIVNRFFNEARAATAIRHPGIVEIYDFGYHTDGSAYIVMEFLEGETLERRIAGHGRLPLDHSVQIARQVCSALGAAHEKGIVHRDLKPDNIFLVRDPDIAGGERIKLLDFGIAKLAGDGVGAMATRTGAVMGTPAYMAPEQCRGAGQVDARADLYSLGCILFHMLCGRPPFHGEYVGDILAAHMRDEPPAPRSLAPELPDTVDRIVGKLLVKRPDLRFSSTAELTTALTTLSGVPPTQGIDAVAAPSHPRAPSASMPTEVPHQSTEFPRQTTPPRVTDSDPSVTPHGAPAGMVSTAAERPRRWVVPVVISTIAVVVGSGVAIATLAGSSSGTAAVAADAGPPDDALAATAVAVDAATLAAAPPDATDPDLTVSLLRDARDALEGERWSEAEQAARQVLAMDPSDQEAAALARAAAAGAKREVWVNAKLTGQDNGGAAYRAVRISRRGDGYSIWVKNQFGFRCALKFDDEGNPAIMSRCKGEEGWSVKQRVVRLRCRVHTDRQEETCRGPYVLMPLRDQTAFVFVRNL